MDTGYTVTFTDDNEVKFTNEGPLTDARYVDIPINFEIYASELEYLRELLIKEQYTWERNKFGLDKRLLPLKHRVIAALVGEVNG